MANNICFVYIVYCFSYRSSRSQAQQIVIILQYRAVLKRCVPWAITSTLLLISFIASIFLPLDNSNDTSRALESCFTVIPRSLLILNFYYYKHIYAETKNLLRSGIELARKGKMGTSRMASTAPPIFAKLPKSLISYGLSLPKIPIELVTLPKTEIIME